jgi:Zn-dependent protease
MSADLFSLSTWVLPALLAITLHEAAHGYAARALGDPTAAQLGRLSLNPLRHIDPIGTIILPGVLILSQAGFLFGYAKPVPVDVRNLRNPRRDMVLVAAAGPGMNLLLALAAALLYHLLELVPESAQPWVAGNLGNALRFNVLLAVFNMLPIPPLDGGRVAVGLLPRSLALPLARLERLGLAVVLLLFVALPLLDLGIDPARWLIYVPAQAVLDLIVTVAGLA